MSSELTVPRVELVPVSGAPLTFGVHMTGADGPSVAATVPAPAAAPAACSASGAHQSTAVVLSGRKLKILVRC